MSRFIDWPHKLRGNTYLTRRLWAARVKAGADLVPVAQDKSNGRAVPCVKRAKIGSAPNTRSRALGVGFHVASVHQQSLAPCGSGLVQLAPTPEILNASSAIISKESGRVDP